MKGIVLAGGRGSRLYPSTMCISKHLLPVYDKPMIYYPLSTLMLAGIRDILIISTPEALPLYEGLLGDGQEIGVQFTYKEQENPKGIAEAFIIGEEFVGQEDVCLILGDNIFYGNYLSSVLQKISKHVAGAVIFGYYVANPSDFGVVCWNSQGQVSSIEEKPQNPKSNFAIPGLYFYDCSVVEVAKHIQQSERGELEVTSINQHYLECGKLQAIRLGRGLAWLDTGTHASLLKASNFVEAIQMRQGLYISCIEEVAYKQGFIGKEQLSYRARQLQMTEYGQYLYRIIELEDAVNGK